jgi:hypothetical protein
VQDRHGRGPWRPGFSHKWIDSFRTTHLPPIYQERSDFFAVCHEQHKVGKHLGCAALGKEGLFRWFSPMELMRLQGMGFYIADASKCQVVIETPNQVLVASDQPLKRLRPVAWECVA